MDNFVIEAVEETVNVPLMQSNWLVFGENSDGITQFLKGAAIKLHKAFPSRVGVCNVQGDLDILGYDYQMPLYHTAYRMLCCACGLLDYRLHDIKDQRPIYFVLDGLIPVSHFDRQTIDLLHKVLRYGVPQNICFLLGWHDEYMSRPDFDFLKETCKNTAHVNDDCCEITLAGDQVLYHIPNTVLV